MSVKELIKLIELLPENQKKDLEDYVKYLLEQSAKSDDKKAFDFKWEGALIDLKSKL